MKSVATVLMMAAAATAAPGVARFSEMSDVETKALFLDHMVQFGKVYESVDELAIRFENFKASLARIDAKNAADSRATYGITKFSDMHPAEFKAQYLTARLPSELPASQPAARHAPVRNVTEEVRTADGGIDWRSKVGQYMGAVRDQGQCGSCWAFSVSEQIASSWAVAGNQFVELAPQQLVDCDTQDDGCDGGDPSTAYQYVISAGGLESEDDYPYTAADGTCKANPSSFAAKISGWNYVAQGGSGAKQAMQSGVATVPLSVCVEADTWQDYSGGVLSSNCGQNIDHCVMLAGYTTGSDAYWIVRNSWGTDWGVQGYIYVAINDQNLCAIENMVTRSTV